MRRSKLLVSLILLILLPLSVFAYEIPNNLWKGLIAEACCDGYDGMYAVACVVRNRLDRGMSLGLVALKRKDLDAFVKRQGEAYAVVAKIIVERVFQEKGKDTTFGATHYENIERYGTPYWARQMIKTTKIKHHTFFKESK